MKSSLGTTTYSASRTKAACASFYLFLAHALFVGNSWSFPSSGISPLPSVQGSAAGYIAADFKITEQGSAQYSIPLVALPGTGGMEPKLAVKYDSAGSNGLLGVGWSLSGLSNISRCPAVKALHNLIDPVDFDGNDKLCLDGQMLVAVGGGAYGAPGTEYRTEIETFSKIISSGSAGSGPASFQVFMKNGLVYEYAKSTDSRVEAAGRVDVLIWRVNKVLDTSGNYMTVEYLEDNSTGESYPSKISYTGNNGASILAPYNTVEFEYQGRSDIQKAYIHGSIVTTSKVLRKIQFKYNDTLVHEYRLNYDQGSTGRSRLRALSFCNHSDICLTPTEFSYSDKVPGFSSASVWISNGEGIGEQPYGTYSRNEGFGDFNGDGKADRYWIRDQGSRHISVALSTGTDFVPQSWGTFNQFQFGQHLQYETVADFNGDGLTDRGWLRSDGSPWQYTVAVASPQNPVQFSSVSSWMADFNYLGVPMYGTEGRWNDHYGDFNGDGRTDHLWTPFNWSSGTGIWTKLSHGNGFDLPVEWIAESVLNLPHGSAFPWGGNCTGRAYSYNGQHERVLDLNADGLDDYIVVPRCLNDWRAFISTGSGFSPAELWLPQSAASAQYGNTSYSENGAYEHFADVTGDGLPDFVWRPNYSNELWVAVNTGVGFSNPTPWIGEGEIDGFNGYSKDGHHQNLVDMNGDGLADLVWVPVNSSNASDNRLWIAYSNGIDFVNPHVVLDASQIGGHLPYSNPSRVEGLPDVNGDGLPDYAWVPQGQQDVWVAVNNGVMPDQLILISHGPHEKNTSISYKSLTDSSVYLKEAGATYPDRDIQNSYLVVASYEVGNGLGASHRHEYFYTGLKMRQPYWAASGIDRGRGLLGFRSIQVTDQETGGKVTSYYHQSYPFQFALQRTETRLANNSLASKIDYTWDFQTFQGSSWVFVRQIEEQEFDSGSLLFSKTTDNDYDIYGNLLVSTVVYNDGHSTVTQSTFSNDPGIWRLGRVLTSQVTQIHSDLSQPQIVKSAEFAYDATTGFLTDEWIERGHQTLELNKHYVRDQFGNITESTVSGPGVESRTTTSTYDSLTARFEVESINAALHRTTKSYDQASGLITSITDPNGLVSYFQYDEFNKLMKTTLPNGSESRVLTNLVESNDLTAPINATYYIRKDASGAAATTTYYDEMDRPLRVKTIGLNGREIFGDKNYNAKGQLERESALYFWGDPIFWTSYFYDDKGRVVSVVRPGAISPLVTSTIYNGLDIITTNPLLQTQVTYKDARGKTTKVRDDANSEVSYYYDATGNLVKIEDPAGNITTMQYDIRGNRTYMTDPNTGVTTYSFNSLGLLIASVDAKGQTTKFGYDRLNRLISRIEADGAAMWQYDSAINGIGKLDQVELLGGKVEKYFYDPLGRLSATHSTVDNVIYTTRQMYDQYGRLSKLIYPSKFEVDYVYDDNGYLREVLGDLGALLWRSNTANALSEPLNYVYGNKIETNIAYIPETGAIERIHSGMTGGSEVQELSFTFDVLGNLVERSDGNNQQTEQFVYDNLNRLTDTAVLGGYSTHIDYDAIGNITFKSDLGAYAYGANGAGPHAVTSIVGQRRYRYDYDANGNIISQNGNFIDYTAANLPAQIQTGSYQVYLMYGADRERYKQIRIAQNSTLDTTTKIYIGKFYEKVTNPDLTTEHRNYIFAGKNLIGVYQSQISAPSQLYYFHKDHLGSIESITDASGAQVERLSYDAWGRRRGSSVWKAPVGSEVSLVDLGFTGHEHLDEVELIHCNGRVYDPKIGRFLSADPYIQDPEQIQNLNRYSYVLNNPLSYTDPSGFFFKKFFGSLFSVFRPLFRTSEARFISSLVFAAIPGGQAVLAGINAVGTLANGGALFDLGISFGASYLSSHVGSPLSSAAQGNLVGAAQQAVMHGSLSGFQSVMRGGKFKHGFVSGLIQAVLNDSLSFVKHSLGSNSTALAAISSDGVNLGSIGCASNASGFLTEAFEKIAAEKVALDLKSLSLNVHELTFGTTFDSSDASLMGLAVDSSLFGAGLLGDALAASQHGLTKMGGELLGRAVWFYSSAEAAKALKANPNSILPKLQLISDTLSFVPGVGRFATSFSFGLSAGELLALSFDQGLVHWFGGGELGRRAADEFIVNLAK